MPRVLINEKYEGTFGRTKYSAAEKERIHTIPPRCVNDFTPLFVVYILVLLSFALCSVLLFLFPLKRTVNDLNFIKRSIK